MATNEFGITGSERQLNELIRKSFLNLWSYSNLFIDKRSGGPQSQGKELCDVLVVCGDDVIIFSDKSIEWPSHDKIEVQWSRWKRRAIDKSADQIRGAARWIRAHPDRIFTDADCTTKLPIQLPPAERMRIHGVVVARGSGEACLTFHGNGSPSLVIQSDFPGLHEETPFWISDPNSAGFYIHVLDDSTLHVLLQELDTIRDFVDYMSEKAQFFRQKRWVVAHGEEEILASYLRGIDRKTGEHKILAGMNLDGHDSVMLEGGLYKELTQKKEYKARKQEDEISYAWDKLIEHFSQYIINGEILTLGIGAGSAPDFGFADHERGVREMALQRRMERRMLSKALIDAFRSIGDKDRFFRMVTVAPTGTASSLAFVFLILKNNENSNPDSDYEKYREVRSTTLYAYCLNVLREHSQFDRVVGLATELPKAFGGKGPGGSEDLLFLERPNPWTEDLEREAVDLKNILGIMSPDTIRVRGSRDYEYPDAKVKKTRPKKGAGVPYTFIDPEMPEAMMQPNRKERRRIAASRRRRKQ